MKPTDKIITYSLISIVLFFLLYGLLFHLGITLKILALIIAGIYGFFIIMHIGLMAPLIVIIGGTSALLEYTSPFIMIRSKSEILYGLAIFMCNIVVLITFYLGVPMLAAILYNSSLNLQEAWNLVMVCFKS